MVVVTSAVAFPLVRLDDIRMIIVIEREEKRRKKEWKEGKKYNGFFFSDHNQPHKGHVAEKGKKDASFLDLLLLLFFGSHTPEKDHLSSFTSRRD